MCRTNTSTSRQQLKVFKIVCAILATFCLFSVECSAYVIPQKDMTSSKTSKMIDVERLHNEVTTELQNLEVDTLATQPGEDVLGLPSLTTGLRPSVKRDASNEDETSSSLNSSVPTSSGVDEIVTTVTTENDEETECQSPSDDQLKLRLSRETSDSSGRASIGYNYTYPGNQCPQIVLNKFINGTSSYERSTCPFEEKTHVDNLRYPIRLPYYQCNCRTGISMNGGSANFSNDYLCDHEFYNVPILRRGGCVDGSYEWFSDLERLPIACVTRVKGRQSS